MFGFSKKHLKICRAMSVVVVVIYAFMTSAIDLFHNDEFLFGMVHTDTSGNIFHNDTCPACKFLDSSNSTEADFSPYLVITTTQVISQPLPHLTVINNDEWSCSITSRAPPSNTIS
jgi:hypothetical protein